MGDWIEATYDGKVFRPRCTSGNGNSAVLGGQGMVVLTGFEPVLPP